MVVLPELDRLGFGGGHPRADQLLAEAALIPALEKKTTLIAEHLGGDQQRTDKGLTGGSAEGFSRHDASHWFVLPGFAAAGHDRRRSPAATATNRRHSRS